MKRPEDQHQWDELGDIEDLDDDVSEGHGEWKHKQRDSGLRQHRAQRRWEYPEREE